jgi:hypothetical protein
LAHLTLPFPLDKGSSQQEELRADAHTCINLERQFAARAVENRQVSIFS